MKRLNLTIEGGPPRSSNAKIDVGHSVSSVGLVRTLKIPTVDIKTAAFKKPRVDAMANVNSTGCERNNRIVPSSLGGDSTRSRLSGSCFAVNKSKCILLLLFTHAQYRQKRLLRNVHFANSLHALLAFLLFFQQFAFARDVAAVALGEHVLAQGAHRLAGHDFGPDG